MCILYKPGPDLYIVDWLSHHNNTEKRNRWYEHQHTKIQQGNRHPSIDISRGHHKCNEYTCRTGVVPHFALKKLCLVMDMLLCWINSISVVKCKTDPMLDNQIVRTMKIGLSQSNWSFCICVVVYNVIIIKCKSNNYLNHIPPSTITANHCRSICTNAKTFKNITHVSSRKCQGFSWQCVFCKRKGM